MVFEERIEPFDGDVPQEHDLGGMVEPASFALDPADD